MARQTEFLNLYLPDVDDVYNVETDQNENFEKIDTKLKEWDTGKEPAITKKSGFNLDKTDEYNLDDTTKLGTAKALKKLFDELVRRIGAIQLTWTAITGKPNFNSSVSSDAENEFATPKAVKTAYDKGVEALIEARTKENAFDKNTAFNKNFGTEVGTVLEGDKIEQITGQTYGGILNVEGEKTAGLTYFDNNTKKLFLCKNNNSDTSANVNNYIALDNNSLLDRLENLFKTELLFDGAADRANTILVQNLPVWVKTLKIISSNSGGYCWATSYVDIAAVKEYGGTVVVEAGDAGDIRKFILSLIDGVLKIKTIYSDESAINNILNKIYGLNY